MTILASKIPILASMLEEYYEPGELEEVAKLFGVVLEEQTWSRTKQAWLVIARQLVDNLEQGNHHALLQTILEQLDIRNTTAIALAPAATSASAASATAASSSGFSTSPVALIRSGTS